MTSATVKTFAPPSVIYHLFSLNSTTAFWEATTYLHTQLPRLSDGGLMGYYLVQPSGLNLTSAGSFTWQFLFLDKSERELDALMAPIYAYLSNAVYAAEITYGASTQAYPDFYSWWNATMETEASGVDIAIGSRLLDENALTADSAKLMQALKQAAPAGGLLKGHLVAGRGVKEAVPAGGSDAVNPAWRKAYVHALVPVYWLWKDESAKQQQTHKLTSTYIAALRDLLPDSGCYINEVREASSVWF